MRLPYDLIVMDLEANQPSGKIFEIGAVRFSRTFVIETPGFRSFVNPDEELDPYIIKLCDLESRQIELIREASELKTVGQEFYKWATQTGKNVCLASWGNYDANALHSQWNDCLFRKKSIDIKSIAAWELARWGIKSKNSLSATLEALNLVPEGKQHSAYDDALNTARVLQELWAKNHRFKQSLDFMTKSLS